MNKKMQRFVAGAMAFMMLFANVVFAVRQQEEKADEWSYNPEYDGEEYLFADQSNHVMIEPYVEYEYDATLGYSVKKFSGARCYYVGSVGYKECENSKNQATFSGGVNRDKITYRYTFTVDEEATYEILVKRCLCN